jgi:glycolate oxidase FAD binding subunit
VARRAVGSRHPLVTAAPVNAEVAAIVDQVRSARARGTPLRLMGAGTWLDAGQPCATSEALELGGLQGITSYEPGDLTLTARAATTLAEIARVTAAEQQWLTLDPHGAALGTIGATVATASAGPLASAFGTPRDHVLGCEFVSGTGDVVQAGGRVVKNVAGFDLVRLVTGAWGTLGALTEITVRLRARPEDDVTLAVSVTGDTAERIGERAWRWTRDSEFKPFAAELISPSLAQRLGSSPDARLLVRLGGNASFVQAARNAVAVLGSVQSVASSVWSELAAAEPPDAIVFRASALPSHVGSLHARAVDLVEALGGYAHATLARGVVRCVVPGAAIERLRTALPHLIDHATIVGERMPAALWSMMSRPASSAALADGVRRAFDPDHIMNTGILGGG